MKLVVIPALGIGLFAGCLKAAPAATGVDLFFRAATPPPADLPADGIYPRGRRLPFMGYSGNPARDLTNGFTVAGPSYGDDRPYVKQCAANGWPVVAHVSHVQGGDHWLFLINSANDPATFSVAGWPVGVQAENAFDATPVDLCTPLHLKLPAYGVAAIRFSAGARNESRGVK